MQIHNIGGQAPAHPEKVLALLPASVSYGKIPAQVAPNFQAFDRGEDLSKGSVLLLLMEVLPIHFFLQVFSPVQKVFSCLMQAMGHDRSGGDIRETDQ